MPSSPCHSSHIGKPFSSIFWICAVALLLIQAEAVKADETADVESEAKIKHVDLGATAGINQTLPHSPYEHSYHFEAFLIEETLAEDKYQSDEAVILPVHLCADAHVRQPFSFNQVELSSFTPLYLICEVFRL